MGIGKLWFKEQLMPYKIKRGPTGPLFTFGWFTYFETMDRSVRAVGGGRRCVRAGSLAEFEIELFATEEKLLDGLAPVFFR